jgi:hypothetical protein
VVGDEEEGEGFGVFEGSGESGASVGSLQHSGADVGWVDNRGAVVVVVEY